MVEAISKDAVKVLFCDLIYFLRRGFFLDGFFNKILPLLFDNQNLDFYPAYYLISCDHFFFFTFFFTSAIQGRKHVNLRISCTQGKKLMNAT